MNGSKGVTLQHKGYVLAVSWSSDGSKICTGSGGRAQVWHVDGSKGATLEHKGIILAVSWSADGSKICTGSRDGTAQVWNVDGSKDATLEHKGFFVYAAVLARRPRSQSPNLSDS